MSTENSAFASHWLYFAEDWQQPPIGSPADHLSCRSALAAHSEAMAALIDTQQALAYRLREVRMLRPCRQFSADFKVSEWQPVDLAVHVTPADNGLDYVYRASGRQCFKGSLKSIQAPDGNSAHTAQRAHLDTAVMLYKLDQFKGLFPYVSDFWIFLAAFTSGHFLWQRYSALSARAITACPQLLGYQTQFDPQAIERTARTLDSAEMVYSASNINVGPYDAFSLRVYADDALLMRTEMGVLQLMQEAAAMDIVLH